MCGTAWAPSMSVVMPRALAAAISRRTGNTVPSALDTWAKASRRVRGAHQGLDRLGMHLAARIHRRDHELRAGLLAQHLPGHDVGVVLEIGDEHLIARLAASERAIALRDQIDGLGRAAHEDDLVARARIDEAHQRGRAHPRRGPSPPGSGYARRDGCWRGGAARSRPRPRSRLRGRCAEAPLSR